MPEIKQSKKTGFEYLDTIRKIKKDGKSIIGKPVKDKKHIIKNI